MSAMAPLSAVSPTTSLTPSSRPDASKNGPSAVKTAFQDAVAGLFFGQMIKSLRAGVGKPAYIHGGQAEEMFQSQMDQKVAENLARQNGGALVEDLYQRFLVDHPNWAEKPPAQLVSLAQSVMSAPTVESAQELAWARPTTSGARNTTGTTVIPALNRK